MIVTSPIFLVFIVAALGMLALVPSAWRWPVLLAASLIFYAPFGWVNLGIMLTASGLTYVCGLGLKSQSLLIRRAWLVLGLCAILVPLISFKYYNLLAGLAEGILRPGQAADQVAWLPRLNLGSPAGYSFYAFMCMSYLADAYSGRVTPARNAGHVALYVAYFPKIIAGPIERATRFLPQLRQPEPPTQAMVILGLQLILLGLLKKVLIADNLAPLVDKTFKIAAFAAPIDLVISVYFFAFQIYCDFSGYSDIAVGLSLLMGIRLMQNFRKPYLSLTTREFWAERWHISLGHWFRDYVYLPLGGSKLGTLRRYANVMLVFLLSGLWHAGLGYGIGWGFLAWGAINGLYQWLELALQQPLRVLAGQWPLVSGNALLAWGRRFLTFHLILLSWIFFRSETTAKALLILRRVAFGLPSLPEAIRHYPFSFDQCFGLAAIAILLASEILDERYALAARLDAMPTVPRWAVYYLGMALLLLFGRWQGARFIYMQF